MRTLALSLLFVAGCATAPTWDPDEVPRRALGMERVNGQEEVCGDEVGGGSCGIAVVGACLVSAACVGKAFP